MAATLDTIDDAVMAALAPLKKTDTNPTGVVQLLDRWAGDLNSLSGVQSAVLGKTPAILVAVENGEEDDDENVAQSAAGARETVVHVTFVVFVVVADVRSVTPTVKGSFVGANGAYKLASLVLARLNNLFVAGTFRGRPLRFAGMAPYYVERGVVYVQALRFTAQYVLPDADLPSTDPSQDAEPMTPVATEINRAGDVDEPEGGYVPGPGATDDTPLQNPRNELEIPIEQDEP